MIRFIIGIIQGAVVGIANTIPGVSGGTMMVTMGIYDRFIGAINRLFKEFKKCFFILLPYGIGIVIGAVALAFAIEFMYDSYPLQTALLFIGLIFGGIPLIFKKAKIKKLKLTEALLILSGIALILAMQWFGGISNTSNSISLSLTGVILLFLLGVVGAATMVIPGVSGSMVLMILGYYQAIVAGLIPDFVRAVFAFDWKGILNGFLLLLPFGLGVLFGIFAVSKLIGSLLEHHTKKTYAFILGLVIASPVVVLMNIGAVSLQLTVILTGIAAFAVGFLLASVLGKKS